MPITNTNGQFSTGRDCTIVLIGPFGKVQLDNVTGFQANQITVNLRSDRLDGVMMNAELPKGWQGQLDVDRGSNALDVFAATTEADWIDAGQYANSTMYQYVVEADGSTTTFAYDNVALKLSDAGHWAPDAVTKQRLDFTANRRRIV